MSDEEILRSFNKARKAELVKIVVRPKFTLYLPLIQILGMLTLIYATVMMRNLFSASLTALLLCIELILFLLFQTKNVLLIAIFCYQKFTPKTIRGACLFTPSCSEYMRLSIMKYGVFQGVKKGFKRLRRCRPPNGGLDEP